MCNAGYCGCPFQDIELETCTDVGQLVSANAAGYCSVFLNSPILSTTTNTYVGWKDLAITSCAVLDGASTYCFRVDSSGGVQRSQASASIVGFTILATGRRLLQQSYHPSLDQQKAAIELQEVIELQEAIAQYMLWNASWAGTGELCQALVHAYRSSSTPTLSSIMDRHALKQCVHWRMAGNETIRRFNLNESTSDTFLVSWHGVSQAMRNPPFVIQLFANMPSVAMHMASYSEWAEPWANMFVALDNYAVYISQAMDKAFDTAMSSSKTLPMEVTMALQRNRQFAHSILPFIHATSIFMSNHILMQPSPADNNVSQSGEEQASTNTFTNPAPTQSSTQAPIPTNPAPMQTPTQNNTGIGIRRLLQETFALTTNPSETPNASETTETTWKDELTTIPLSAEAASIQAYSTLIGLGVTGADLAANVALHWSEGPFLWDKYSFALLAKSPSSSSSSSSSSGTDCPSAIEMKGIFVQTFASLGREIISPSQPIAYQHQRVAYTLPPIHKFNFSNHTDTDPEPFLPNPQIKVPFWGKVDAPIDLQYVVGFLMGSPNEQNYTLAKLAKEVMTCDFEKVVLQCKKKRANLVVGTLAVLLLLSIFCVVMGPTSGILLTLISVPMLILWYVYGYSFGCIPMLPVCVVTDFVDLLKAFVPMQFSWPGALQRIPGCASNTSIAYRDCFRSCLHAPFYYHSWESTVAWAVCDWDPYFCQQTLAPWVLGTFGEKMGGVFHTFLMGKGNVALNGDAVFGLQNQIEAERFCFVVTLINVTPYLILGIVILYGACIAIVVPLAVLQGLFEVSMQVFVYVHASVRPRSGGSIRGNHF